MAKRARGQELGGRRLPGFMDVAGAPKGHICTPSGCQRVRTVAEEVVHEFAPVMKVPPKRVRLLTPHLPKLICSAGKWPPPGLKQNEVKLLFYAFVMAVVETGVTGLRGESGFGYQDLHDQIVAAKAEDAALAEQEGSEG